MSKRRAIISYDKLTIEQKKQILKDYPDGYINHLTTIKTPTGEVLDALIWETEEVIYLVKINKIVPKAKPVVEDEDEDFEDDLDKVPGIKDDELDEDEDEDEDDYDKPEDEDEDDDEDDDDED
ncbi:MAG: hypothetical protein FJZ67_04275 [Bacteroidetes bacterium]|nr:hypothetical protein [Bacteroidota bacterium]